MLGVDSGRERRHALQYLLLPAGGNTWLQSELFAQILNRYLAAKGVGARSMRAAPGSMVFVGSSCQIPAEPIPHAVAARCGSSW